MQDKTTHVKVLDTSAPDGVPVTVLRFSGDITSASKDAVLGTYQALPPETKRILLDMSKVDFMDTTALAVIVTHWRRLADEGGQFLLAGARYRYTKALWITGLADRLPMYDTVGEALAATGSGAADGPGASEPGEPGGPDATAG